jgi:rare lipoprotein A
MRCLRAERIPVTTLLRCGVVWALAACGGSTENTSPPPRSAANVSEPRPPTPSTLHGFDPRLYYDRKPISVRTGGASFYADSFAGKRTANGERYDPRAFTCAHRSLPFGSILRVTHVKTGDWVLVRVNDRGPYAHARIVDLSREAAKKLSILQAGVARVKVEVLQLGDGRYVRR